MSKNSHRPELSGIRQTARDQIAGKGVPGRYNPQGAASRRFVDRKKAASKKAARGRSW